MALYIHQQRDWPNLKWNQDDVSSLLTSIRHQRGRLIGRMEAPGFNLRAEAPAIPWGLNIYFANSAIRRTYIA
jgi:hypothetical protein